MDLVAVASNMGMNIEKLKKISRCDIKAYLAKSHKFLFINCVYCDEVDEHGNGLASIYKEDILIKKRNPDLKSDEEWIDYKTYKYMDNDMEG